jgi:aminomethyltransferase
VTSSAAVLSERHHELGATFRDFGGVRVVASYSTLDVQDQVDAVRERAGLCHISGPHIVHVRGADAVHAVDHACSRNILKLAVGRSTYTCVPTEFGTVTDDAIVYRWADDHVLVVHGGGETQAGLRESAHGRNVYLEPDSGLQNLALQGPRSLDVLAPHTPMDLPGLRYFHHEFTTLFGKQVMLSRTGYSGERGYEVFCRAEDAVEVWDQIVDHGAAHDVLQCAFDSLDVLRVEAGLLAYPQDMNERLTPWECGLGFTVARDKGDFRGKEAVFAAEGRERVVLAGLVVDDDGALEHGTEVHRDGRLVGTVSSSVYSHRMDTSLALAHLEPSAAAPGTELEVRDERGPCRARVERLPFYDPDRTRVRALT